MKRIFISFIMLASINVLSAQISFNTGNTELDADLNIINTDANKDLSKFKTDMNVSFGVSITTIDNMFQMGMAPGEVYLSLEIANTVNKPLNDVVTTYRLNKGKGWGVIAQEMGIKPGSDEFHALKGKCKNKKDHGNGNGNGRGNGNK
jgi:hypothetical protein